LLVRRPGVALALLAAAMVAALPAAAAPLFLSSAQHATLHRQVGETCLWRVGAQFTGPAAPANPLSFRIGLGLDSVVGAARYHQRRAALEADPVAGLTGPASAGYADLDAEPVDRPLPLPDLSGVRLLTRDGFQDHVEVLAGPVGEGLWLPQKHARAQGLEVGDELRLSARSGDPGWWSPPERSNVAERALKRGQGDPGPEPEPVTLPVAAIYRDLRTLRVAVLVRGRGRLPRHPVRTLRPEPVDPADGAGGHRDVPVRRVPRRPPPVHAARGRRPRAGRAGRRAGGRRPGLLRDCFDVDPRLFPGALLDLPTTMTAAVSAAAVVSAAAASLLAHAPGSPGPTPRRCCVTPPDRDRPDPRPRHPAPRPAVVCEGVERRYGTDGSVVPALRRVSLSLPPGTITALVGPSGSGKSTLLRLLGCVDLPDSGGITIDGTEVSGLSRAGRVRLRRTRLGFLYQNPVDNLLEYLTVLEHFRLAPCAGCAPATRRWPRCWTGWGWPTAAGTGRGSCPGVSSSAPRWPGRCGCAPSLLLGDEPTGHQDRARVELVLTVLRQHAYNGAAVLVASHDQEVIHAADRVVTLADGRITSDTRTIARSYG
jgi:ABC-type lipoprotein export system ATPase subunit